MHKIAKSFIRSIEGDTSQPSPTKSKKENCVRTIHGTPMHVPIRRQTAVLNSLTPNLGKPTISSLETSLITCDICLEQYSGTNPDKLPRTLPYCGHSICHECLGKLIAMSKDCVVCHICKKRNSLTEHKSPSDFPCTWALVKLCDEFSKCKIKRNTESESICNVCKKHEISHCCRLHMIKLCAYCAFRHMKECKENMMLELSTLPTFYTSTINQGRSFLNEIASKIQAAKKAKIDFCRNMEQRLEALIKLYNNERTNIIAQFDFYILQLELLQKSIISSLSLAATKNELLPTEDHSLKSVMRNTNKLEEQLLKHKATLDTEYQFSISFDSHAYESCLENVHNIFHKVELTSPYLKTEIGKPQEAVFLACEKTELPIVDFLIGTLKVDKNVRDSSGRTPFCISVCQAKPELYQLLYEKFGCDVNIPDNAGKTPLMYACLANDDETVEYLIKRCRANPDLQNKWKDTALHFAVEAGNLKLVKLLVENAKADKELKNGRGKTALELAVNEEIRQYLLQNVQNNR